VAIRNLANYLRAYRKADGLSQEEVAFLLGTRCGTKVSRYELFRRKPTLETVFAYQVIFGVPASELFAGVFRKVERETLKRARRLAERLSRDQSGKRAVRKVETLSRLMAPKHHSNT